jgi:hypothetical protein
MWDAIPEKAGSWGVSGGLSLAGRAILFFSPTILFLWEQVFLSGRRTIGSGLRPGARAGARQPSRKLLTGLRRRSALRVAGLFWLARLLWSFREGGVRDGVGFRHLAVFRVCLC